MKATIEQKIWLALKEKIDTIKVDVKFEILYPAQRNFEKPQGLVEPFIRVAYVSNQPENVTGNYKAPFKRSGYLVLSVVFPIKEEVDFSFLENLCGNIADHFSAGAFVSKDNICVIIPSYPHIQAGFLDDGYWTMPIRVSWQCYY